MCVCEWYREGCADLRVQGVYIYIYMCVSGTERGVLTLGFSGSIYVSGTETGVLTLGFRVSIYIFEWYREGCVDLRVQGVSLSLSLSLSLYIYM